MQGCVSVTNILVGIGLLSMPYAVSLSGTVGIFIIALCCLLFNSSGKFIAWGLDLLPDSNSSYFKVLCPLELCMQESVYCELRMAAFDGGVAVEHTTDDHQGALNNSSHCIVIVWFQTGFPGVGAGVTGGEDVVPCCLSHLRNQTPQTCIVLSDCSHIAR